MADYDKACCAADDASAKAAASKAPADHKAAQKAHKLAASAAFASGNPTAGKMHSKKAQKHKGKGGQGGGKDDAPVGLGAWAKKNGG